MINSFKLTSVIGPSYSVDPDDTWRTKSALENLGYYSAPKSGLSQYPDERMFEGLKLFQRDQGLLRDGIMKPDGPTANRLGAVLKQAETEPKKSPDKNPDQEKPDCPQLRQALGNAELALEAARKELGEIQREYNRESDELNKLSDAELSAYPAIIIDNLISLNDLRKGKIPRGVILPSDAGEARKAYLAARKKLNTLIRKQI